MALDDVVATRAALRDEYRDAVDKSARGRLTKVEGGPWDGVPVLTEPLLNDAIAEVFDHPIPRPSEHDAELSTPARVLVAAICPRCDLPTTILVTISPELRVDDSGSEIHVKTKSKARSHICHQQEIPFGLSSDETEALEQTSFDDLLGGGEVVSAEELLDLLSLVKDQFTDDAFPDLLEINGWTEPVREQVREWATAFYNADQPTRDALPWPRVLGGDQDPPTAEDEAEVDGDGTGETPEEDPE